MDLREKSPREIIRGLMRGNRADFKLGYSPANAVSAMQQIHPGGDEAELRGYSQGFSDGMRREPMMVVPSDPDDDENQAYREGYADGRKEPFELSYPSSGAI